MPIISAFDVEAGKRCNFDDSVCYVGNSKSVSKTQGNLPLKKKKQSLKMKEIIEVTFSWYIPKMLKRKLLC